MLHVRLQNANSNSRVLFCTVYACTLMVYLCTAAPTVTAEDSGELITAAYTLGISHPPGYPLWCLLGKLFTLIIPVGSIAWRVNLLSAVLGACASGIVSVIANSFTKSFWASLTAGLLFGFSRDFWSQCVIAEVYSLNVLFFLIMLWCVIKFDEGHLTRYLYLAASVYGLSLTNHSTMGPLGIALWGYIIVVHRKHLKDPVLVLNMIGAFLLSLSVVLYLPLRSSLDPYLDWGNPETIVDMVKHLLRRQYSEAEIPRPRTTTSQMVLVGHFIMTYGAQFTLAIGVLMPLGMVTLLRSHTRLAVLILLLFVSTTYGFIWLLNYPADRENLFLTRPFFLPSYAISAVCIAVALQRIVVYVAQTKITGTLRLYRVVPLLAAVPLLVHYRGNDRSNYYWAYDWGCNMLRTLKRDAIIFPTADHCTFPLIYLTVVEGMRPDIIIGDKYGYIEDRLFSQVFRDRQTPQIPPPYGKRKPYEKERYLVEYSGRPVYFTTKTNTMGLNGWEMRTSGILFEMTRKGGSEKNSEDADIWNRYEWHTGTFAERQRDFSADIILSDHFYAVARQHVFNNEPRQAVVAFRISEEHGRGIKEIHNNLGGALAEAGHPEAALGFLMNAVAIDNDYDLAAQNIASCMFTLGRYSDGLEWFRRALEEQPHRIEWLLGIARGSQIMHDIPGALSAYAHLESLLGEDPVILTEIGDFLVKSLNDRRSGDIYYEKAQRAKEQHKIPREVGVNSSERIGSGIDDPIVSHPMFRPEALPSDSPIPGLGMPRGRP